MVEDLALWSFETSALGYSTNVSASSKFHIHGGNLSLAVVVGDMDDRAVTPHI